MVARATVQADAEPLDLASPELVRDPYPSYAAAREAGRLLRLEKWDAYAVTSREDCLRILGDDESFDAFGQQLLRLLQAEVLGGARSWRIPDFRVPTGAEFRAQRLTGRRTTGRALANRFIDELWPPFEAACRERATRLAAAAAHGAVDLVKDYAMPLVTGFLADLMAIGPEGADAFRAWVEGGYADAGTADEAASRDLWRALSRQAVDRVRNPREDFLGHLVANPGVHRTDDSSAAAHLEFAVSTALMISRVTHQGLTLSFSTLMNALLEHPDQYALLRADRGLIPGAVEEGLRFDSATQALGRLARDTVQLDGVTVTTGSLLILFIGAANRDPAVWERAERFDVTRPVKDSARHLSFGHGSSSCLGGGMSRRILGCLLGALVDRFTRLSPADGRRWFAEFATRGLTALPAASGSDTGGCAGPASPLISVDAT